MKNFQQSFCCIEEIIDASWLQSLKFEKNQTNRISLFLALIQKYIKIELYLTISPFCTIITNIGYINHIMKIETFDYVMLRRNVI